MHPVLLQKSTKARTFGTRRRLRKVRMLNCVGGRNWIDGVNEYQKAVACVQHDSAKLSMGTQ